MVHFKWIALILVVPSPKHYDALVSDLRFSGAPNTSSRQGTPIVVLVAQRLNVCHDPNRRLDHCRPNVWSAHTETAVCARGVYLPYNSNPALALS